VEKEKQRKTRESLEDRRLYKCIRLLESADECTVLEDHRKGLVIARIHGGKKGLFVLFEVGRSINEKRGLVLEKFFHEAAEFATGFSVYSKTSWRRRDHSLMKKGSKFLFYTE